MAKKETSKSTKKAVEPAVKSEPKVTVTETKIQQEVENKGNRNY